MAHFMKLISLLTSILTFVYTFYVVGKLMMFLSLPKTIPKAYIWIFNILDNKSRLETAYGPIMLDTLLLIGFIFQHSFMKSQIIQQMVHALGLSIVERTIYNLTSSLCLQYLMKNWLPAQSIVLWQVNVEESKVLYWIFVLVHAYAWIIIYGGSIIMDLPEILGIKQTYYDAKDLAEPMSFKSRELARLYKHVRHPSFFGFTVIFWATNLMTIDRLILSIMLTTYMYFAWSTDKKDYLYQKLQRERKLRALKLLQKQY